ncbi:MAG TPA: hypothetical protein DIT02_04195 [Pantoea ananatis]|nr:hypothetical protein [Pantoea ananatis]
MIHSGNSFALARANRTHKYDEKVKPVIEELIEYGYGNVALANALNERGILSVTGLKQTAATVTALLKRLGIKD